ncbi:MAG: glycosyltransferase family 39 protein [Chloroflexota bacterium]
MQKNSIRLILLGVTALSYLLNLHNLGRDSFWGDEILTASFASQAPIDVIRWTAQDIHPPLYYLVAGTFTRMTVPLGATINPTIVSDWLWRFPSVIFGVLTVAITYRLAQRLTRLAIVKSTLSTDPKLTNASLMRRPQHVALIVAVLLAVAPIAIRYGQEARMHALFMCLSALATLLFFQALNKPKQWFYWVIFGLITTANIYTMYFGFLILAVQGFYLLFNLLDDYLVQPSTERRPDFSAIIGFTAAAALAFILYIPWWPVLLTILQKRSAVGAIEGGVGDPLTFMTGVVRALGPNPVPVAWIFFGLFILGLLILVRDNWSLAGFAFVWLALPSLLPIFLGDPRALQFRYAFILPIYLTIVAYGILNIVSTRRLQGVRLSQLPISNASAYLVWVLLTLSFIATLNIYNQVKPDWRRAATYLDKHANPADIILIGPLWDEGRFISYYYRGQAQLLTPAALVTNIERRVEQLRNNAGRVWAVNRFAPTESPASKNINFVGNVILSEPQLSVYEPNLLAEATLSLATQAVEAAYPWAAAVEADGVINPDPRTAQAVALRALGDTQVALGQPEKAVESYQTAVDIFPGWVSGFIVLGETQEAIGNLPEAAKAYQQAVSYNLDWHGPAADAAVDLLESGSWEAAITEYHKIIGHTGQ